MEQLETNAQHAGEAYLRSLSTEQRRDSGRVYTPSHLVRFVLDSVGYEPRRAIETACILDPAAGSGVFLEEALRRLAIRVGSIAGDVTGRTGSQALLDAARRNLVGVDVDPVACRLARETLARAASALTRREVSPALFAKNIVECDFLSDSVPPVVVSGGDVRWVVGNPPYVAATRLSAAEKRAFRRRFRTASGRIDLYALFFERALSLLRPGAKLGFITPDKYLSSQSGSRLRHLLTSRGAILRLARFETHRVFADAATVPCITIFEAGAAQGRIEMLRCSPGADLAGTLQVRRRTTLPRSTLGGAEWNLENSDVRRLSGRIRDGHATLAKVSLRVSSGIATGLDSAFLLPLDAGATVEPELLHPAVRGRDLGAYGVSESGLALLLPYRFDGPSPRLVDLNRFPRALRHLSARRVELERRHCVRTWSKAWYDVHDPVPLDLSTIPKILVPDVADENRFAFDTGRFVPLHSAYYIVPNESVDARYVTAILNSRPIEFLVRTSAPIVKDGFSRYRRQFLVTLPVPAGTSSLRRDILRAYEGERRGDLDMLACGLFELDARDLRLIDRVLADRRARRV